MKKTISMILALVMVLGLLPAAVFATGTNNVYISVSFDGRYIDDQNGSPIVYVPVSLDAVAAVDLNEYGLSEYLYDPDGDGNYETTALQLVIYAHENIYGGDWSDVNFTGGAGSSYFQGGIFGFTENLNYFLNGEFPIDEALSEGSSFAVGATSDHIVLEAGDFIDIASFTSFAFLWDSAAGFHLFADENDSFVHSYTAKAGEAVDVKLLRLCRDKGGVVVTNDYNLNKVAGVTGIRVLNINDLANAVKPMLLSGEGEQAEHMGFGSTLSADSFPARQFDFMLSNPPYGKSWKVDQDKLGGKKGIQDTRFVTQFADDPEYKMLPRSSDGQMLFLLNNIANVFIA